MADTFRPEYQSWRKRRTPLDNFELRRVSEEVVEFSILRGVGWPWVNAKVAWQGRHNGKEERSPAASL